MASDTKNAIKLHFHVERTEYADIVVDVPMLLAEWGKERAQHEGTDEEFVKDALWEIGVQDLMYSGDFIQVLDSDTDEDIRFEGRS